MPSLKVTIHASHRKADVAVHVIQIGQIGVRSIVYWQGFMGYGLVVEFTMGPYLILIAFGVPRELLKLWDLSLTKIIKFYIENVFRQNSLFVVYSCHCFFLPSKVAQYNFQKYVRKYSLWFYRSINGKALSNMGR